MKLRAQIFVSIVFSLTLIAAPQAGFAQDWYEYVPTPVLTYLGIGDPDYIGSDGNHYTRYDLSVANWQLFPAQMFVLDSTLPPCGRNPDASRTWVYIYDQSETYIYGFCGQEHPHDLTTIWFAKPLGEPPPTAVYITVWYRPLNLVWTSNLLPILDGTPNGYLPIPQPLLQGGGTNLYPFENNLFNYKVNYPPFSSPLPSGVNLVVQPILVSQGDLDARVNGTAFQGVQIVPYDGTGGFGVLFRATCEDADHNPVDCPAPGVYDVKTSWELAGPTSTTPAFLKADEGSTNWENIFTAYAETRTDPTGSGRTCCRFSDFVFVDGVTGAAPVITINTPQEGAIYTVNQSVAATYFCVGDYVESCFGPEVSGSSIDTSSPGTKTFTVNATVSSGPTAVKTVTYQIAAYNTDRCLLYNPDRYVKSGATFPIKLQVCDANGKNVSSPNVVLHALLPPVKTSSYVPKFLLTASGNANPSRDFRFDSSLGLGGGYIVNVSTKGLSSGTWKLNFTIAGDPVTHSAKFGVK